MWTVLECDQLPISAALIGHHSTWRTTIESYSAPTSTRLATLAHSTCTLLGRTEGDLKEYYCPYFCYLKKANQFSGDLQSERFRRLSDDELQWSAIHLGQ